MLWQLDYTVTATLVLHVIVSVCAKLIMHNQYPINYKPHVERERKAREREVIYDYFYNCGLGQTEATVAIYKFC